MTNTVFSRLNYTIPSLCLITGYLLASYSPKISGHCYIRKSQIQCNPTTDTPHQYVSVVHTSNDNNYLLPIYDAHIIRHYNHHIHLQCHKNVAQLFLIIIIITIREKGCKMQPYSMSMQLKDM